MLAQIIQLIQTYGGRFFGSNSYGMTKFMGSEIWELDSYKYSPFCITIDMKPQVTPEGLHDTMKWMYHEPLGMKSEY